MAAVGPRLVGLTARLQRTAAGRRERVLVDAVHDLGAGKAIVIGRLLYRPDSTAYNTADSRGRFSTLHYRVGQPVDIETTSQDGSGGQ